MPSFTIVKVSSAKPRSWSFTDKRTGNDVSMETYKVMFEGENDPVEINKPLGKKPTVGEVLTGTIEDVEFGDTLTRRFKAERKPFTKGYAPKDEAAIKAMWSIGQAVAFLGYHPEEANITDIEPLARDLFAMVDRVKTGELSGFEKAVGVAAGIKAKTKAVADLEEAGLPVEEEPVNIDDIPF